MGSRRLREVFAIAEVRQWLALLLLSWKRFVAGFFFGRKLDCNRFYLYPSSGRCHMRELNSVLNESINGMSPRVTSATIVSENKRIVYKKKVIVVMYSYLI